MESYWQRVQHEKKTWSNQRDYKQFSSVWLDSTSSRLGASEDEGRGVDKPDQGGSYM